VVDEQRRRLPQLARFYDVYKDEGAQRCWHTQDGAKNSLEIEVSMAQAPLDEQNSAEEPF
jgi:hypothetical protein